jgi:three-Cys-motif partner protein
MSADNPADLTDTPAPDLVQGVLFDIGSEPDTRLAKVKTDIPPLWTNSKADLIAAYLLAFVQVTHHGTYIDGFAGPQHDTVAWSARKVLEIGLLRHFFLCDRKAAQLRALRSLQQANVGRDVRVIDGDFNNKVDEVLSSGVIDEREAAFCLLDQRTFECHWSTVERLARHKKGRHTIELFYFLANHWFSRAMASVSDARALAWWGREDWRAVALLSSASRAELFARRFRSELGYLHVSTWAIYDRRHGRRIMDYMIHASDHDRAPELMEHAYRKAVGPTGPGEVMELPLPVPQDPAATATGVGPTDADGI